MLFGGVDLGGRTAVRTGRYGIAEDLSAKMVREDIDAVVITTPHSFHFEETMSALENGKHVLVEKPTTNDLNAKMKDYFSKLGIRSSILDSASLVLEELLMNAIYVVNIFVG